MVYRWLNFHLPYACRHSGACCKSGWPIPVEPDRVAGIEAAIVQKGVRPLITPWSQKGVRPQIVLATTGDDICTFHNGRCGIYSWRPQSCVHFPYVCLIDQRGVHITLSHYCPTAASLLFEHTGPIEIVEGPAPIAGMEIPEGLDARESLPPRATADRLMGFAEFSDWEAEQVQRFKGSMVDGFGEFAPVVERYLAAKLFASWAAYRDDGTEAVLALVERARTMLESRLVGKKLDDATLKEAIRQTDFDLLHRC